MNPRETVNQTLRKGAIEAITDAGEVTLILPDGRREVVRIPLEHVARVRAAAQEKV